MIGGSSRLGPGLWGGRALSTSTEGDPIDGRPYGKGMVEGEGAEGFQGRWLVGFVDKTAS